MIATLNGIELHYEAHGDGEPLLWLHGGMGCGADWQYIYKEPPAGYRLLAPDLRGHGATASPSATFTFRQMALDVRELLQQLGIPRVKAIGLSGGGIVLLHLATIDPACVESMIVVSAPPYFPEQARAVQRVYSWDMLPDIEKQRIRKRHQGGQLQIDQLLAMTRRFAEDRDDPNFTPDILKKITAETLIVFGDRDPLYPVSLGIELYQAIPKAYLWVVANGGHGPIFREHAARFNETALAFLRGEWK